MKRKIEKQQEALEEKEKRILLELETNEQQLRKKAKTIGKIALISGIVALLAYWGFKLFSGEEEQEPKRKKKKKRSKSTNAFSQLVTPYVVKFLGDLLEINETPKEDEETTP